MQIVVRIELTEELLGTKPSNDEIFEKFLLTKLPKPEKPKDEAEAAERAMAEAEDAEESGTTVFHTDALGNPGIWDYQIKGFFKDAAGMLNRADKAESGLEKLTAHKTKIDGLVFVGPRFIKLQMPAGAKLGLCERPLRADTPQGPRVGLCRSQTVPAGTAIEFTVTLLSKDLEPYLNRWLEYGQLRGLGCWRNSGKGRFTVAKYERMATPKVRDAGEGKAQ